MKNPFRKKNQPALPGPDDPLNALALKTALANLDAHHADIAEFKASDAEWQSQLDQFIKEGDPMDHKRAIGAAAMKTRLEMFPHYLARAEEKIPALVEAVVTEMRAFETRILDAAQAEIAGLDAAIVPAVQPFCHGADAALSVARSCSAYSYFPAGRQSTLLGKSVGEFDSFWNLGHESFPFQQVVDGGGLARAEQQVRGRIAELLDAYAAWKERGQRFTPPEFVVAPLAAAGAGASTSAPVPATEPVAEPDLSAVS